MSVQILIVLKEVIPIHVRFLLRLVGCFKSIYSSLCSFFFIECDPTACYCFSFPKLWYVSLLAVILGVSRWDVFYFYP